MLTTRIPSRGIPAALAAAIVTIALALAVGPSHGSADPALDGQEATFLGLLNDYRAQQGKSPLAVHWDLNEAADWYATDMATKNYFGHAQYCGDNFGVYQAHCDSLGRWPKERVQSFGYPQGVGENSAAGFSTPQAVFDAWKGSPGHNANMLGGYTVIGIGFACQAGSMYGCYWVTDFGYASPPPSTSTPAPTTTSDPTPLPTATPVPTATPSPTPALMGLMWDDLDCSGFLSAADGIPLLASESHIDPADAACPLIGDTVVVAGVQRTWGDVNCSGVANAADSIQWLYAWANLPIQVVDPSCPLPGTPF